MVEDGGGRSGFHLHHLPQPPPTSTNLLSEQPSQLDCHPDRVRVASQHEPAHRALDAQGLASVAQVPLGDAASVDEQQLVADGDPRLRAGALRDDVVDHDVRESRSPGGESQPTHVEIAGRVVTRSWLDDGAAADIVDDQPRPLEYRIADDAVDVRSHQEALVLAAQSGGRRWDLHAAEPELVQAND